MDTEIERLLRRLAEIVRPIVIMIEDKPMVTKDHYGEYLMAIDRVASMLKDNRTPSLYLAIGLAFQQAGARKAGVQSALRIMGYL